MNVTTLSPSDLRRLQRVAMARSLDLTKPTLSGLYLEPRGPRQLSAAATTGFMLAFTTLETEHQLTAPVLIPATACRALAALRLDAKPGARTLCTGATLRDDGEGSVELVLHETRPGAKVDTTFTLPRSTPSFPAWRKILGTDPYLPAPPLRLRADLLASAEKILRTYKGDTTSFQAQCMTPNGLPERVALAQREGVVVGLMPFVLSSKQVADEALLEAIRFAVDPAPEA